MPLLRGMYSRKEMNEIPYMIIPNQREAASTQQENLTYTCISSDLFLHRREMYI